MSAPATDHTAAADDGNVAGFPNYQPPPHPTQQDEQQQENSGSFHHLRGRRGHVNYYTILGVSVHDSEAEIRKAFRHLSVSFHPDRTIGLAPDVVAMMSARFCQINEAYQVLSDPKKRAAYDALGVQGVKELALVPTDVAGKYDAKTMVRLLTVAHEEKQLLKTAARIGSTSKIEAHIDGATFFNALAFASLDVTKHLLMWTINDPDQDWKMPGGKLKRVGPKKKKEKPEVGEEEHPAHTTPEQQEAKKASAEEVAQHSESSGGASSSKEKSPASASASADDKTHDKSQNSDVGPAFYGDQSKGKQHPEEGKTKQQAAPQKEEQEHNQAAAAPEQQQDKTPENFHYNVDSGQAILVNYNGKPTVAIIPDNQERVKEAVEHFNIGVKKHNAKVDKQNKERIEAHQKFYERPPLHTLLYVAGSHWLPKLRQTFAGTFGRPYQFNGRYAYQLPLWGNTLSLFAVSAKKRGNDTGINCSIDTETRSSYIPHLKWLVSGALGTMGSKLVVGFERILSTVWKVCMRLTLWKEGSPNWLPQLWVFGERKLNERWTLMPHLRLPGPWEDKSTEQSPLGNFGVNLSAGENDSVGVLIGKGAGQVTYTSREDFVLFPEKGTAAATNDSDNNKKRSALPFLRSWVTTRDKNVEFHVGDVPVLRHEEVYWFMKPFDSMVSAAAAAAAGRGKNSESAAADQEDATNNNASSSNTQQEQNGRTTDDNDSSDDDFNISEDDDDDELDHLNNARSSLDSFSSNTKTKATSASSRHRRRQQANREESGRNGSGSGSNSNTGGSGGSDNDDDEAATVAAPILRHGFGVSIQVTVPILHMFSSLGINPMPKNRGNNTTLSLLYRRGEHQIQFPIRLSFASNIFVAGCAVVAPYLLNRVVSRFVVNYCYNKEVAKSLQRRIRGEGKVRRAMQKARLVQNGLAAQTRTKAADEKRIGGLVIVNATYGVLDPKIKYPDFSSITPPREAHANLPASTLTCDATVALQNLVRDSAIKLSAGSPKHVLAGVFDPQPWVSSACGEKKQLKVVYEFHHRRHEVTVDDMDALNIPLIEHLVRI